MMKTEYCLKKQRMIKLHSTRSLNKTQFLPSNKKLMTMTKTKSGLTRTSANIESRLATRNK